MNMSANNLGVSFGHGAKFLQTHFRTPPNRLNKTKKGGMPIGIALILDGTTTLWILNFALKSYFFLPIIEY
jgi:hypothetical protein